ncbi:MAG: hypothetical protein V4553_08015 [Bacteroidota bacterium]
MDILIDDSKATEGYPEALDGGHFVQADLPCRTQLFLWLNGNFLSITFY